MDEDKIINEERLKPKNKKGGFRFLIKFIIVFIVTGILLTAFLKIIFKIDTADAKDSKNIQKWEKVAGPLPNSGSSFLSGRGGTVIQKAIECHKYLRENGYTYGGGYSIPDGIFNSSKIVDCSAFVSWVLYEVGCDSFKTYQETEFVANCSSGKHPELIEITNKNDVQPGDVLVYRAYGGHSGHVELAAQVENRKVTRVYNCGSDSSISSPGTTEYPETSIPFRDIAEYENNKIYRLK